MPRLRDDRHSRKRRRGTGASVHHNPEQTTVAILGNSPVVCRAIAHLVESGGYETRILDTVRDEAALAGVDMLLIAAGGLPEHTYPARDAIDVPALRLVDTFEEEEALGGQGILWPCTADELHDRLSSAIGPAYERSV